VKRRRFPPPNRGRLIWSGEISEDYRALLLRMIVGETTGLEDYGAQLRDAAATH
jgi:hypothetical protein